MKKKILIVDDEKDIRSLIEKILGNISYEVSQAKDGQEMFNLLEKNKPDLILLDVMMPGVNGYEICHLLKRNPDTASIPVVLLTVLSGPQDASKGMAMGAAAYLTKPFDPDDLGQEIEHILNNQSPSA